MPWKETCAMDQKVGMVGDYLRGEFSITELSRHFAVSRKTIYKWVGRYKVEGAKGLEEHSRAPGTHPNATAPWVARELVAAKLIHQRWGPKNLLALLWGRYPGVRWPAASTAGEILKRQGLVISRRRRHRTAPYTEPFGQCKRASDVWSADFKGQFRTGDGILCYPLTVSDSCSRYLLLCHGLIQPTFEEVRPWFEWLFRRYGMPKAIRTDNGPPFASVALGGLSKLSAWFISLGIRPERIEPGHPEQNGRHERLHRTLKEATAKPPRADLEKQQRAFDEFLKEYNLERPHEALGQRTPGSIYTPSLTPYPERLREVEYEPDFIVRRVRSNGEIRWKGKMVYVSEALIGEQVALREREEHLFEVRFSFVLLGVLNELTGRIMPQASQKGEELLPISPV